MGRKNSGFDWTRIPLVCSFLLKRVGRFYFPTISNRKTPRNSFPSPNDQDSSIGVFLSCCNYSQISVVSLSSALAPHDSLKRPSWRSHEGPPGPANTLIRLQKQKAVSPTMSVISLVSFYPKIRYDFHLSVSGNPKTFSHRT